MVFIFNYLFPCLLWKGSNGFELDSYCLRMMVFGWYKYFCDGCSINWRSLIEFSRVGLTFLGWNWILIDLRFVVVKIVIGNGFCWNVAVASFGVERRKCELGIFEAVGIGKSV